MRDLVHKRWETNAGVKRLFNIVQNSIGWETDHIINTLQNSKRQRIQKRYAITLFIHSDTTYYYDAVHKILQINSLRNLKTFGVQITIFVQDWLTVFFTTKYEELVRINISHIWENILVHCTDLSNEGDKISSLHGNRQLASFFHLKRTYREICLETKCNTWYRAFREEFANKPSNLRPQYHTARAFIFFTMISLKIQFTLTISENTSRTHIFIAIIRCRLSVNDHFNTIKYSKVHLVRPNSESMQHCQPQECMGWAFWDSVSKGGISQGSWMTKLSRKQSLFRAFHWRLAFPHLQWWDSLEFLDWIEEVLIIYICDYGGLVCSTVKMSSLCSKQK